MKVYKPKIFSSPLVFCLLVYLFISSELFSQKTINLASAIDNHLQKLSGFGYSGSILVVKDGEVILKKGYGYANREKKIFNTPETVFDIGSLAKNLTAAAILKLEQDGKLRTEDMIAKFLNNVPADKMSITIHQLLTHTSGITGPEHGYSVISKDSSIDHILNTPLQFQPGSKWAYSNSGYVLLSAIIESASGMPYQEYMISNIFIPAGMNSTGFWGTKLPTHKSKRIAIGYDELGVAIDLEKLSSDTWNDIGSGQIVTNINDLYKWQQCLEQCKILSKETLKKMLTPVFGNTTSSAYYDENYGYGIWSQILPDGSHRYQHGGNFLGFNSQFTWLPDQKIVILSLCNIRIDLYPVNRRADRIIPEMLAGANTIKVPDYIPLPIRQLNKFIGTFQLQTGEKLTIYQSADGLAIGADGQDATLLLDNNIDKKQILKSYNQKAVSLLTALFNTDDTGLDCVGFSDPDSRNSIHAELDSLRRGLGSFIDVHSMGTYFGGLNGRFVNSILVIHFEKGIAYYKIQWNDNLLVGTNIKCPHFAASIILPNF